MDGSPSSSSPLHRYTLSCTGISDEESGYPWPDGGLRELSRARYDFADSRPFVINWARLSKTNLSTGLITYLYVLIFSSMVLLRLPTAILNVYVTQVGCP